MLASKTDENNIQNTDRHEPPEVSSVYKKQSDFQALGEVVAWYQRAVIAQQQSRFEEAEDYFQEVLEEHPDHLKTRINLATVSIHLGKLEAASRHVLEVLEIEPHNAKALVNLGVIALKQREKNRAEDFFQQALDANPHEEAALVNLAYMAEKEKNFQAAISYYQRILEQCPDNGEILLAYAHIHEQLSRYEKALELYERCLSLHEIARNSELLGKIEKRIRLLKTYRMQFNSPFDSLNLKSKR